MTFLARCGPRTQAATGLASMNDPWRDVCCGFCVAKTIVPCDMETQSNTEAIVDKSWKYVAENYPQPSSTKRLKWDTYFAFFNNHFMGIQEARPPEGFKPFARLWAVYKRARPSSRSAAEPSPSISSPHPCPTASPSSRSAADPSPSISSPHPCPTANPSSSQLQQQPAPAAGVQQHPAPATVQQPASAAVVRQPLATPTAGVRGLKAPTTGLGTALPAAAGGQHQHHPPVQHHRQTRRGQWAQALIQSLIHKVDNVQETVNRLEGMVYQLPTLLPYTGEVYQPHELQQCRQAALALGLTICQLPQLDIDMAAVVAASILITRVYNHMVFSSVNANSKTQYGTGQRVQVVLAKSDKNSSGDLDTTLQLLSDNYNAAVYSALTAEKKKEVDEAKEVLAQYLTLLQPVLRQLLGRPLNALASIITDPTWQRRLNRNGNMVTTLAQQLAQAQAPHTDFLPAGPGMDDGLVFLLALQDFPLVAYMGSHKLSRLAAAHCRRTADGQKQVVEVKDMDALAMTLPLQLGTEVLVKAGQLVLFRGNTVHAGNVGVAGSCCARLYGFGRPDTVADNTTMNTSELGDLYHGLFQPIQDEGIGPKMANWNRRGMAGQWVRITEPYKPDKRI
ncbi:hypothetical protein V8C86DRAFT_3033830 [Haematococcus lacustris]